MSRTAQRTSFWQRLFSRKSIIRSMQIIGLLLFVYITVASSLIYWPRSDPFQHQSANSAASDLRSADVGALDPRATLEFIARDGERLVAKAYGPDSGAAILFLHGVAANQTLMQVPAQLLSDATGLQVITLDLRGHGLSSGPRNDVQYIGQYEDDIEDVIQALLSEGPGRAVLLAGHSMGGGIAMRYALKADAPDLAGYILFAPNFGEGPTEGKSGNTPNSPDSPIHFDLQRMIGQIMMNIIGVHAFDHEPILHFNFPPEPQHYTYRAVMSGQPIRPNTSDKALMGIDVPFLVLVGTDDEVFNADAYPDFITAHSDGETRLIDEADHVEILFAEAGYIEIEQWFTEQFKGTELLENDAAPDIEVEVE